jgi:choline kinase
VTQANVKVAVLLVAGSGTRLGDPAGRPKSLVEIGGRSMLTRAIEHLLAVGVEHLVFATGYREESIREAVRDLPVRTSFCRNDEYASTQNSVSLLRCRDAVGSESFFKLDGDVVFRREVLDRLLAADGAIAAAVDARAELADEEMKVYVDAGRITHFGKGLDPKRSAGESIGIERVDGAIAERLFVALAKAESEGRTSLYYEDVYQELIDEGVVASAADVTDLPWIEVDTRDDLARAVTLFGE